MNTKTLLIVENDAISREGLAIILKRASYQVDLVANGRAALTCLAQGPMPALILLEMLTPIMDGWKFLEAKQRDAVLAKIPVVIMTGLSIASKEWATSLGAVGLLRRPIEVDALLDEIGRHC